MFFLDLTLNYLQTIDQFFKLDVPMDMVHLRALLIGIVRSLEAYLLRIVSEQGLIHY